MPLSDDMQRALDDLEQRGLLRQPQVLTSPQGPEVSVRGRAAINLCSNNYLGLAADPRLASALDRVLDDAGVGSGASRHIGGSHQLHRSAEQRLAHFTGLEDSRLFSSGYAANVGTLQALVGPGDHVFSDELNHASLIDGCRLSRANIHVYPHADVDHLRRLLRRRSPSGRALVVTDGVFSMDGDRAPVHTLRALCDELDVGLLVDEAHALGVLGPGGRGVCAEQGVRPDVLVGTLGKAFGAWGAFVASDPATVQWIENRARSYVFSTGAPPLLAAIALRALELVAASDDARARVLRHARQLARALQELGYQVSHHDTPILPVVVGDPTATMALSAALLDHGVFVHGIRPPTVPPGTSRLRVTTMATHRDAHLQRAVDAFRSLRNHL